MTGRPTLVDGYERKVLRVQPPIVVVVEFPPFSSGAPPHSVEGSISNCKIQTLNGKRSPIAELKIVITSKHIVYSCEEYHTNKYQTRKKTKTQTGTGVSKKVQHAMIIFFYLQMRLYIFTLLRLVGL